MKKICVLIEYRQSNGVGYRKFTLSAYQASQFSIDKFNKIWFDFSCFSLSLSLSLKLSLSLLVIYLSWEWISFLYKLYLHPRVDVFYLKFLGTISLINIKPKAKRNIRCLYKENRKFRTVYIYKKMSPLGFCQACNRILTAGSSLYLWCHHCFIFNTAFAGY